MEHRFADPQYFKYLWLLLPLFLIALWVAKAQTKRLMKGLGQKLMPFLTSSISQPKRRWKLSLEFLVIGGMIFAAARPQSGQSRQKVKSEGIELMVLFDVSQSMLAEDVKPSRLELAKNEVTRFLDLGGGDRVGLVAFAGSAIALSPLTPDKVALKMFIDSLTPESVSTQGTDFERALLAAKGAFERGGVGNEEESVVTKAVLIVSDGEDQEQGALDAAKELKEAGIKIFAMGFGTEKGGAIPVRDDFGNLRGYKKDQSGKVVLTQTKGTVLKELAKIGGGAFYHVTFGGNAIHRLKEDLAKLEQAEFANAEMVNFDEKFQVFLVLALLLALIELLLSERRGTGRIWKGRFEVTGQ